MATGTEGGPHNTRGMGSSAYIPPIDGDLNGGGTYTNQGMQPSVKDWENFLGPSGRDIKEDPMRHKRHGRIHLPQAYVGPSQYLTDRVDGLITDATNSPFTTKILPYKYQPYPDNKIKWNVWSFDEGMASRVPYESAARTLTQSKRAFAGYMVRQGLAIVLEHNFMMSEKGRDNFQKQLMQMVGSIQYTNDLDVHIALVQAPSYEKHIREKYFIEDKSNMQILREYVDIFGFMQKNNNALDILIEEAKARLKSWGGPMPDFLMCNSKLTFQLTMTPEKTNWVTNGYDGQKRLKTGPDIPSYRGINVIHSRCFSMEGGTPPRDILRRRVRVAEYYRILPDPDNVNREFQFYNEERDTWFSYSFEELLKAAIIEDDKGMNQQNLRTALRQLHGRGPAPSGSGGEYAEMSMQGETGRTTEVAQFQMPHAAGALGVELDSASYEEADVIKAVAKFALCAGNNNWKPGDQQYNSRLHEFQSELRDALLHDPKTMTTVKSASSSEKKSDNQDIKTARLTNKIKLALLFESFCDYPRNIGQFNPIESNLSTCFKFKSGESADFQKSIRFRNWMRYGAASELFVAAAPVFESLHSGNVVDASCTDWMNGVFFSNTDPLTKFSESRDNGMAFLREPGAFLAPNHFKHEANYDTLEAFCGANVILTREMVQAIFKCINGYDPVMRDFTMSGCWIFDILTDPDNKRLMELNARIKAVIENSKVGMGGVQNRIDLTQLLIDNGLLDVFKPDKTTYTIDHPNIDYIWTWPYVKNTTQEVWCHENDYRLLNASGNPVDEGERRDLFPKFQVGNNALKHWKTHLNSNIDAAVSTAPLQNFDFARNIEVVDYLPTLKASNTNNKPQKIAFNVNWQFSKPFANIPTAQGSAFVFVIQLVYRFFCDQSNRSTLTNSDRILQFYKESLPSYLLPLPRNDDPRYSGSAGGEFYAPKVDKDLKDRTKNLAAKSGASLGMDKGDGPRFGASDAQQVRFVTGGGKQAGGADAQYAEESDLPPPTRRGPVPDLPIEIVVLRPNIEHHMLGIIMGQGGENLGNTLWGQTELSCYDDSMHGIWGMSYKYHERAIVFNEKNLVRLWDVAYDGYSGGKNDVLLNWAEHEEFKAATNDISTNYRGASMVVMAFYHSTPKPWESSGYKRNWPSPIVFHDTHDYRANDPSADVHSLSADADNTRSIKTEEFRVFNAQLYSGYEAYRNKLPNFMTLHTARKPAGTSGAENETVCDALAFQGTMKIMSKKTRMEIETIQGSGHHGPDWVGVASVRAGKGYKVGGPLSLQRLV